MYLLSAVQRSHVPFFTQEHLHVSFFKSKPLVPFRSTVCGFLRSTRLVSTGTFWPQRNAHIYLFRFVSLPRVHLLRLTIPPPPLLLFLVAVGFTLGSGPECLARSLDVELL